MTKLVILFGEQERKSEAKGYVITRLAEIWRQQGLQVETCFGPDEYIPGDLAIVHVDRSVVPEAYLELAARYPAAVNGSVRDIRKSTFSSIQVTQRDEWPGPVIVKSDFNFAGVPESTGTRKILRNFSRKYFHLIPKFSSYKLFKGLADVPSRYFSDDRYVVEKFIPERNGNDYCVRTFLFLGNNCNSAILTSRHPIVTDTNAYRVDTIEPHPELWKFKERIGIDYGKFDYVLCDGSPVILDVNKTVGLGDRGYNEERNRRHFHRAQGIFTFLDTTARTGVKSNSA